MHVDGGHVSVVRDIGYECGCEVSEGRSDIKMIPYQRRNLQSTDRKGEGSVGLTYENLLYKIIANGAIAFFMK